MGLDIIISTNNINKIYSGNYFDEKNNYFNQHSLSRTFCNFMSRRHIANGKPELDQIGEITGIDISPIYDMEKYWDDLSAEHQLSFAENTKEKEEIKNRIEADKNSLKGNIDNVVVTISQLIQKLSQIQNLNQILNDYGESTIDYDFYFTDFNIDKGEGYIRNNFGQDLRNFKRFLDYAKSTGATTVFFNYG
ncbi:hypothetical protein [Ferruginibacter sp.]